MTGPPDHVNLRGLNPAHLRELADLVEADGWAWAGQEAEILWRPALGAYRKSGRPSTDNTFPEPPPPPQRPQR